MSDEKVTDPKIKLRSDGWKNLVSGLGTNVDKRTFTNYKSSNMLGLDTLSGMYVGDGLIQRIVNAFPDDMTRQWIEIDEEKEEEEEGEIELQFREIGAQKAVNTAVRWARLMGGSLLYIGAMDGKLPQNTLNLKKVKNVEFLRIFDLGEIDTNGSVFQTDSSKPDYGKIVKYKIKPKNYEVKRAFKDYYIHASRCIEFHGAEAPQSAQSLSVVQKYWGLSVVQSAWDYIRDFSGAMGSVSQILYEFVIGKYKLADLDEILMQGNEKMLQTRMQAIELSKSMIKAVLIGTDEDYIRDSISLSGIPDVIDRFMMMLSGIVEIPVTRLFGRSPAGLNATGENDMRNYYDAVKAKQQNDLHPAVAMLISIVASTLNMEAPPYKWNPLQQLSEKEAVDTDRVRSEVLRTQADADQRYIMDGVLTPEEVYSLRFEDVLGPKDFEALPDLPIMSNDPDDDEEFEEKKEEEEEEDK